MTQKGNIQNIIIIVLTIIVSVLLTYILMTQVFFKKELGHLKEMNTKIEDKQKKDKEKDEKKSESGDPTGNEDYEETYAVLNLEAFTDMIVNPVSNDGPNRLLMISIAFEYKLEDKKLPPEIDLKIPIMKSEVNTILASQSFDVLGNAQFRPKLQKMVKDKINTMLTKGQITRVFFTQFVLQ